MSRAAYPEGIHRRLDRPLRAAIGRQGQTPDQAAERARNQMEGGDQRAERLADLARRPGLSPGGVTRSRSADSRRR